jgi:hypothetical protein
MRRNRSVLIPRAVPVPGSQRSAGSCGATYGRTTAASTTASWPMPAPEAGPGGRGGRGGRGSAASPRCGGSCRTSSSWTGHARAGAEPGADRRAPASGLSRPAGVAPVSRDHLPGPLPRRKERPEQDVDHEAAHRAAAAQAPAQPRRPHAPVRRSGSADRRAPIVVERRSRVGDWEGDLIVGRMSRSGDLHLGRLLHRPSAVGPRVSGLAGAGQPIPEWPARRRRRYSRGRGGSARVLNSPI